MSSSSLPDSVSVLLLHNIDPAWLPAERDSATSEVSALVAALLAEEFDVEPRAVETASLDEALAGVDPGDVIVLNLCEGLPGVPRSEPLVPAELDHRGFTYTGSPTAVLEMSWDKALTKRRLWQAGVPTPEWRTFVGIEVGEWDHFPAIVKPAQEHGSLGVTRDSVVLDVDALAAQVSYVLDDLQQPAIVERFIDGREFHVSVWGNGTLRVLPPAEMDFSAFADACERLCTFDAKVTPGSRHWDHINVILPAVLDEDERRELSRVAIAAFRALGCRDYARIDLRQDGDAFTVLDVNPNCDLSAATSTALAAELAMGSHGALLGRIVGLAATRRSRNAERRVMPSLLTC